MSERDNTVNGDQSRIIGFSGLSAAIKGVKATARKVAVKSKASKHDAPELRGQNKGVKKPKAKDDNPASVPPKNRK